MQVLSGVRGFFRFVHAQDSFSSFQECIDNPHAPANAFHFQVSLNKLMFINLLDPILAGYCFGGSI